MKDCERVGCDMRVIKLSELRESERGRVTGIDCAGDIKRRLMELGIVPGTVIGCVISSALGYIKAYSVKGSVIAIRKRDAEGIEVGVEQIEEI